ncbi:MAG: relaxase/mobilization nuclease domain-containing protein [Bacteroidales bacterium]|nr:relaxase/mobilization nuclease domain-containing protein [Bacteroidales bacterium]
MIGKITKGSEFAGCVSYVLREDKARLLASEGVSGTPEEMAEQFELQTLLNDKVKNTVGHISLSFSPEDGDRLRNDDRLMVKIAYEYMEKMGIRNTQFIIARHTDRNHPHCHIVFNRVDNNGKTISDKNDRYRNEKVCKALTEKYGLYMADGKEHVNTERLRPHDRAKYDIYEALKQELPKATSWEQLREALHKQGIMTEFKYSRTGDKIDGVKFFASEANKFERIKGKHVFSGSKIDRKFSFANIEKRLERNKKFKEKYQQTQHTYEPHRPMAAPRPQAAPIQREEPKPRHEESSIESVASGIGGLFTPSGYDATAAQEAAFAVEQQRLKKKKKRGRRI